MRYFCDITLIKWISRNRESLCGGNTVTQEFQNHNCNTRLKVQEGLLISREERSNSRDQFPISEKELRSAVLRLGWKYQRSGRDYIPHVLIQAHSDLSYHFECGFQKTTTSKCNSFRLYLVLKPCQKNLRADGLYAHWPKHPPMWHSRTKKCAQASESGPGSD